MIFSWLVCECTVEHKSTTHNYAHLQVTHWPKEDYGKFYNGDSYIVLHTYKKDPSSEVSIVVLV